jgi:3-methyl-2-oxobutanoate hydroxymethyltransferase
LGPGRLNVTVQEDLAMPRITAATLLERKRAGEKIAMLTAYDYPSAQLMDSCGVDVILVGDSCAMVMMGEENTLSIGMDAMLHHCKMVSRATKNALVLCDMPYMSYHVSPEETVRNAGRLVMEGGAQAVKLEGPASKFGADIEALLRASIPVVGHLGLTPQSINTLGGFKVQGRGEAAAEQLVREAKALQALGCCALVLECIPAYLGDEVTRALNIPTIGIGAGPNCDGQVLVMHDMLGLGMYTKFSKVYADMKTVMAEAFTDYIHEVKAGAFPTVEHSFK